MISGVYAIRNTVNEKMYIGSARDIKYRWRYHRWKLNKNRHDNQHLQNAWNKYGTSAFSFSIIESVGIDLLCRRELYWIDNLRPEYNIQRPNLSLDSWKTAEETKLKISKSNKGKVFTKEHRQNLSEAGKGRTSYWKGKHLPEEMRHKMSIASIGNQANKGKRFSEEHCRKIGEANRKRVITEATRKKMSDSHKGKSLSKKQRRKISNSPR